MKKQLLTIVALLCVVAQGALAANTRFESKWWDEDIKQIGWKVIDDQPTIVIPSTNDWYTLGTSGSVSYYEVNGTTNVKVLVIQGEVHLILCNDATLNTQHIKLEQGNTLHIHRETGSVFDNIGKLIVSGNSYEGAAGIGGGNEKNAGDLYVHDGDITVTTVNEAAGIGGGCEGSCGKVVPLAVI